MKRYIMLFSFLLAFVLPNLLFTIGFKTSDYNQILVDDVSNIVETKIDLGHTISVLDHGVIKQMDLDEYVLCVLLGEMPADFEMEALMAQAIAIRTYTLQKISHQSKHSEALVCTDASCCQAYTRVEDFLIKVKHPELLEKMRLAVQETYDMVLTYDGELIEATYFSCAGGKTEAASDVWGKEVPYLQSVLSPGEEGTRHYESICRFKTVDFLKALGIDPLHPLSENDIKMTYTIGNGVNELYIGDEFYTGNEIRTMLKLPSTFFRMSIEDDEIVFSVRGYGHRVGMSQYGAEAMAVSGQNFEEILLHYFPGTKLEQFTNEQMNAVFDKA